MDALQDYLDELEDLIETGRFNPITRKISVEKDRILDIINEIRMNLPDDFNKAKRILLEEEKIIKAAEYKAINILDAAEAEAKMMTNQHELFRRASEQASELIEDAKKQARELRAGASGYVEEKLELAEKQMREYIDNIDAQHKKVMEYYSETLEVLYDNRQELRR